MMEFEHPAEHYVLGTLLLFGEGIEQCDKLDSRHFETERHQVVWQTIKTLFDEGKPYTMDVVWSTIVEQGNGARAGGWQYVYDLGDKHGISCASLHVDADMLCNRMLVRAVAKTAGEICGQAVDGADGDHILETAEREFLFLQNQRETRNEVSSKAFVRDVMRTMMERSKTGGMTGIRTGFTGLDDVLHGLNDGALLILAARPAMGKTAYALNIILNAAVKEKRAAAIFSLEMGATELGLRMLACQARVPSDKVGTRAMSEADYIRVDRATNEVSAAPITVVDASMLTASELRSHARKLRAQGKLDLLVVDYLQLMSGDNESREREIGEISRSLKLIAKELAVPVVALSQLNRGVESRQDKRPTLSDLRDSGSIEQDADVVMFIYRDEVYNQETTEKGIAEIIIAKNRHGPTAKVRLRFDAPTQRFDNLHSEGPR